MSIHISAVICTHNRAEYLSKAIRSLTGQTLDKSLYEIIVVDNASTDSTRQIVAAHDSSGLRLHYVYESALGLSRARNAGWREAEGEYVAYLDDDAIACIDWLERIVNVFEEVKPRPGCVGGKVEPLWEAPRPGWLSDDLLCSLSIIDWSPRPTTLNKEQWLAGANMAFPKSLLRVVGGFDVDLGRRGNRLLSMEEVLLRSELEKIGYSCHYDPAVRVLHHIPNDRLTRSWLSRRWYWQGVSGAVIRVRLRSLTTLERVCIGAATAKKLIRSPRQLVDLAETTNDPDRFTQKCLTFWKIGYILGLLALSK